VFQRLKGSEIPVCPFANLPNTKAQSHWGEGITAQEMLEFRWVEPQVILEIAFTEWTSNGSLRHSAFLGMREDKAPEEVQRS
jgi:bifunctional non-homologous end joining protein LigD